MGIFTEDYSLETIVLGGGCFWCMEAVFKLLKGVISAEPGYAGGKNENNPSYEEIRLEGTGYAEVVEVKFDPEKISLNDIFTVFFATHDPTTLNCQDQDIGEQYRSIILYTAKEQKEQAKKFIDRLNKSSKLGKPIVTELEQLEIFHPAEPEHRNYYKKHQQDSYCKIVINPKLKIVQEKFSKLLKNNKENFTYEA